MDERIKVVLVRKSRKDEVESENPNRSSEAYIRFLSYFGFGGQAEKVSHCGELIRRKKCLGSTTHRGGVALMCRLRVCPTDDWIQVRSQVIDMKFILHRLFEAVKQPEHVWTLDFTMGSDLWKKVPQNNLARLRQIAYETMQEYLNAKWGFEVAFGFDAVAQFWHSEEAGKGYDPHVHAILPRVFVDVAAGRYVKNVRMNMLMETPVKKIWRRRVEAEYGRSRAVVAGSREKFSVKIRYTTKDAGLDKRLRYMYRGIVWDYAVNVNGGLDYSGWDRRWVAWTLAHNHKRHQSYGLLAAKNISPKSRFMRSLRVDLGVKRERERIRRASVCPECGAETIFDHDVEGSGELTRKEALEAGLPRWKSVYADENLKWRDFVPYAGSVRHD